MAIQELKVQEIHEVSGGDFWGSLDSAIFSADVGWATTVLGAGIGFTVGGLPGALIGGAVGWGVGDLASLGFAFATDYPTISW